MQVIEMNLLDNYEGIICHQVNCMGVMGSGVAAAIRAKHPRVFADYKTVCDFISAQELLGRTQLVPISWEPFPTLYVANLFGQFSYGSGLQTAYGAVERGFEELAAFRSKHKHGPLQVYVPYLMGCALAGGDWDVYSAIIDRYIPDAIACKLPG